tara:strand:+ start:412 stop:621 length:210 start_codon:yes stop_codon:yes gene_type:complete
MTTQLKKNNLPLNNLDGLSTRKKNIKERPNIDHLVKRILSERRQENKKQFLIFAAATLVIVSIAIYLNY